jgi:predicted ABC-type exoprotein transport system permease subunit
MALSCPSSFGHSIVLSFFFWSFYCLVLLLLVIVLSCPSSFGHSIVFVFFLLVILLSCPSSFCHFKTKKIKGQKEEGKENKVTKGRRTRQ